MALSISLSRRQTMHLQLNRVLLKDALLDAGFSRIQITDEVLDFLQRNLRIEIENTKNTPAPLRITAPQCIDIFRKNKTSSSGL